MLPGIISNVGLLAHAERIAQAFHLSPEHIAETANHCVKQINAGLKDGGATQIPTFVTKVPDGSERGTFLAVDLGGTNCRICLIRLNGDTTYAITQSKHIVPLELRVNSSHVPLFAFIAERIKDFIYEHPEAGIDTSASGGENVAERSLRRLGFTFSFTYESESLSRGTMLQWDKGWDIPDAIGRDPCQMLQSAIDSISLPVRVSALTSDSVGTLMAKAYTSPWKSATLMGTIFGTGTNAAYIERRANVKKLGVKHDPQSQVLENFMVINTEWGAWIDDSRAGLSTTSYDAVLDKASTNPKRQILEKRMSGLYLGELVRLAIQELMEAQLFQMKVEANSTIHHPGGIDTSFLSVIAQVDNEHLEQTRSQISTVFNAQDVSIEDARAIQLISRAVVRRAARLAGASMASIILQSGRLNQAASVSKHENTICRQHDLDIPSPWMSIFPRAFLSIGKLIGRLLRHFGLGREHQQSFPTPANNPSLEETDIIDIGVDGSLYEYYPTFEEDIRQALRDVPQIGLEGEQRIRIGLAKDGSSLGAALVAQSVMCE